MVNLLAKLEAEGIVQKGMYSKIFEMDTDKTYLVLRKGKFGVISNKGRLLIGCKYESISKQSDGTYKCIGLSNKFFYTDIYSANFKLL